MKVLASVAKAGQKAAAAVETQKKKAAPKQGIAKIKPKNLIQTGATAFGLGATGAFVGYRLSKSPLIAFLSGFGAGVGGYFLDLIIQTKLQGVGSSETIREAENV